jgi:GT2 family glycosyltransferase
MISLIISTYKHLDFLDLVLRGIERQSYRNFEVIIAEGENINQLYFFKILWTKGKSMGAAIYMPSLRMSNKQHRQIWGCNWGILREHILSVNGFDEDYIRAGAGEDLDINWRLKANGISMRSMKNKAIVYHLYHVFNYNYNYNDNDTIATHSLMDEKEKMGHLYCLNGIEKTQK